MRRPFERARLDILVGATPDRAPELRRLVASLEAHTVADFTLHVGYLAPPTVPLPDEFGAHVAVAREWPRRGVSAGYNRLAAVGRAEWMAWLNDDAEVEPGWDAAARRGLDACPGAGIAALPYLTPHPPAGWHVNEFPPGLPYANFGVLRREVFARAGGFDERVWMYGCDNALCFRILAAGLGVLPVADARVVHHYRDDARRADNMQQNDARRAGWDAAFAEWRPRIPNLIDVQRRTVGDLAGRGWRAGVAGSWVTGDGSDEYARRHGRPLDRVEQSSERAALR